MDAAFDDPDTVELQLKNNTFFATPGHEMPASCLKTQGGGHVKPSMGPTHAKHRTSGSNSNRDDDYNARDSNVRAKSKGLRSSHAFEGSGNSFLDGRGQGGSPKGQGLEGGGTCTSSGDGEVVKAPQSGAATSNWCQGGREGGGTAAPEQTTEVQYIKMRAVDN